MKINEISSFSCSSSRVASCLFISDSFFSHRTRFLTAQELYKELIYDGINVDVMHAERSAAQREEVIKRFRTGDIWVLICTDLMARGECGREQALFCLIFTYSALEKALLCLKPFYDVIE